MSQEDVRGLVPRPQSPVEKPPLYRSKHPGVVEPSAVPCSLTGTKQIASRATMGPGSGEEAISPAKWLKAHEKEPQLPPRECRSCRLVSALGVRPLVHESGNTV